MKEKNVIDFKTCSDIASNNCERTFLKKVFHSIKESAFIGSLNGSISGAITAILATYGYIALPGFGPIVTMGISIAFSIGIIVGAMIGSITGIFIGTFCVFIGNLYTSR